MIDPFLCLRRQTVTTLLLLTACGASATAQTDLFDDRNVWTAAAAAPISIETFESADQGFLTPPTTFDSGLTAGLASGSVRMLVEAGDPDGFGFVNTTPNGANYLRYGFSEPGDPDTGSYSVRFDLPDTTTAFGFDLSGWQPFISGGGPGQGGTTITLFSGPQVVDEFFLQSNVIGDLLFIGLTNTDGFDQVRLNIAVFPPQNGVSQADDVAFDDVAWAVPAPSSVAVLGLGALIATRRRR